MAEVKKNILAVSSGVGCQYIIYPVEELAHFDIDPRKAGFGTTLTP